jgi:hypothetical protein
MASSRNSGSGVDRLLAQIRPRWTRERHERVFAAIVERIRLQQAEEHAEEAEHEHDESDHDDDDHIAPSHFEGGHSHA